MLIHVPLATQQDVRELGFARPGSVCRRRVRLSGTSTEYRNGNLARRARSRYRRIRTRWVRRRAVLR